MMNHIKRWMIFLLAAIHLPAMAQTFSWKSGLDTVPASAFYAIPLSIDWLVHLKPDLSDIRIKDEDDKAVPFLIKKLPSESNSAFINFPILRNNTDSAFTTVDIDASEHHGTDHLYLIMSNNAVERFASLSGSDDLKQWFIIDEKLLLTNKAGYASDQFVQELSFPFIRYRFLRLTINNRGTYPLQILKAGIFADTALKESLQLYPYQGTTYIQKDSSDGNTYVSVHNQEPCPVDRISMVLSGPRFYSRQLKVFSVVNEKNKNLLGQSIIRSSEDASIWVMAGKTQDFLLVIENGDNPSLKVNAVNTQCRMQQLIAYLEKGKTYTLFGGNDSITLPDYDLALFRDSVPAQPNILKHSDVVLNDNATATVSTINKSWWIWPAIVTHTQPH